MTAKRMVTAALLAFVAVSLVTLVVKEVRGRAAAVPAPDVAQGPTQDDVAPPAEAPEDPESRVVVYYFHGNFRCVTCNTIEAYTREALAGLADADIAPVPALEVVNVDEPANRHFYADYELTTRTVVVAEFQGSTQVRWKKLEDIWDLVRDRDAFLRYVREEVEAYTSDAAPAEGAEA